MNPIKTQCINGDLQVGDLAISTPDDDYSCLIGRVLRINPLGTPEHDEETDNDCDDVHVNFLEFEYPKKRIKEIEDDFCGLYGEKKIFEDCPLDDTIMNPHCLIRVTDIDEPLLKYLLQSGYNAACYCYGILSNSKTVNGATKIDLVKNEMTCLNRATSGFKLIRMINGVKMDIELTSQEVSDAFYIQEHENHLADIAIVLEEMESNEELSNEIVEAIKANKDLMAEMVSEYENNLEDYGMEWNSAATAAINAKFKSKGENQDE